MKRKEYLTEESHYQALRKHDPVLASTLNKEIGLFEPVEDLRAEKQGYADAAQRIIRKAEAEDRGLSDGETEAFNALSDLMEAVDKDLERRDFDPNATPLGTTPVRSSNTWHDSEGREVRVYAPDEPMFTRAFQPLNDPFSGGVSPDMTVGRVMRAMALGPRDDNERRSLTEGTSSAGGYTVPVELMTRLIDRMRNRARVIQAGAMTVNLVTEQTSIARLDSDPVAAWRLEEAAVAESDPVFSSVSFTARSLAVLVKASEELLQDSVNIEAALENALTQALALELDRVALLGSGSAPEPRGLANTAGINVVEMGTNGAALSGYGELLAAMQATSDANAPMATAAIMAPRTLYGFAGLTATDGQPLQPPQLVRDVPMLETTQVPVDDVQGTATDASRIFVGDWSKLMVGVRQELRIEVLRERFRENLQVGFIAHLRADVAVEQPSAFSVVQGITP